MSLQSFFIEEFKHFQRGGKSLPEYWEFILESPQRIHFVENEYPDGKLGIRVLKRLRPYFDMLKDKQPSFDNLELSWWSLLGFRERVLDEILWEFEKEFASFFSHEEYQFLKKKDLKWEDITKISESLYLSKSKYLKINDLKYDFDTGHLEHLSSLKYIQFLSWTHASPNKQLFDILSKLPHLRELKLSTMFAKEEDSFKEIQSLGQIKRLEIEYGWKQFKEEELESIFSLNQLVELRLCAKIPIENPTLWKKLGEFSLLENLCFECDITVEILEIVSSLKSLSKLFLDTRTIKEAEIFGCFEKTKTLKILNLILENIGCLESLAKVNSISSLGLELLSEREIAYDETLSFLKDFSQLVELEISFKKLLSDLGMESIAKLKQLY